ncbi:MAG: MFS transporter, partial [Acidobacteria bacterium]|nr:MFS transporter [Acidobacteriota bacterium]
IDEIIPSRFRGRIDIAINGTYWGGALIGSLAYLFLLNQPSLASSGWGWRIGFFIGPVLGLIIIFLRRHVPESPRWQITHGHEDEAEANVARIEREVAEEAGSDLDPVPDDKAIEIPIHDRVPFRVVAHTLFRRYPKRTLVAFAMMVTQSFLYNAIFFTYAIVLTTFYKVPEGQIPLFFIPFAIGNLAGPLLLGPLFDTVGRKQMIFGTYAIAAIVLAVSGGLFAAGVLTAVTQTVLWCICFFFASAGASSAYLTVSETFPLQLRGQAISYFFSIGQIVGAIAPSIFGLLIGSGSSRGPLAGGYYFGAAMMLVGGVIALVFGVRAERASLEDISDIAFMDEAVEHRR